MTEPVDVTGGRWVVVNGGALAWVDQLTGRRWTLDPDDIGDQLWTAAPEATLSAAFGALVGLVRDARTAEARLAVAHDVIRRLVELVDLNEVCPFCGRRPRCPDGSPCVVARARAVLDAVAGPNDPTESNIGGGTSTPNDANAGLHQAAGWLSLRCGFCGHWEKGQFTKEQVAQWLSVHRNAMVGPKEGHTTTASTCPHPCGTPLASGVAAPEGDDRG